MSKIGTFAYDDGTPFATDVVVINGDDKKLVKTRRSQKLDNEKLNFDLEEFEVTEDVE